jgi:hypothetical protein
LGFYIIEIFLALLFPSALGICNFLGSFFTVILGFVFPFLIYRKFYGEAINPYRCILNWLLMGLGVIGGLLGIFASFIGH